MLGVSGIVIPGVRKKLFFEVPNETLNEIICLLLLS